MVTTRPSRAPAIVIIGGHVANDLYQGAVPALLPFLIAQRDYGYVAAAGITLAATLLSSVVQPLFGMLTDRRPLPWLVPAGMATAAVGVGLCGLAESYVVTWIAIAVSGLGVAAYHPEAARLARVATRGSHIGMGWFSLGGNVGFALGPVAVTPVVATMGLAATPWLALPGLVGALATTAMLRWFVASQRAGSTGTPGRDRDDWPSFLRLTGVITCRSIIVFGLSTFLAVFVQQRLGFGSAAGAAALTVFFASGAASTLLGGYLATRWGRVRTVRLCYLIAVPALLGVAFVPGPAIYGFVVATAAATYVPFSLHVTLGQDYLPSMVGTASGVTLGVAVSIGGLAAPLLGAAAEATTLQLALGSLAVLGLVAWALARPLGEPPSYDRHAAGGHTADGPQDTTAR